MVKNPPFNAGNLGSIPALGSKVPHASVQLSPGAVTTEPAGSGIFEPQLEKGRKGKTDLKERSCILQLRLDRAKILYIYTAAQLCQLGEESVHDSRLVYGKEEAFLQWG